MLNSRELEQTPQPSQEPGTSISPFNPTTAFMTGFLQKRLFLCQRHSTISFHHNYSSKSWKIKAALITCPKWVNANSYFIIVKIKKSNLEPSQFWSAQTDYSFFEQVKDTPDSSKALRNPLLIIDNHLLETITSYPTTIMITTLLHWIYQETDQHQEIWGSHQHRGTWVSGHPHRIWGRVRQWQQPLWKKCPYLLLFPLTTLKFKI